MLFLCETQFSIWKIRLVLDRTQFRVYSSSERPVFVTLSLFWQLPEEILSVCRLYGDFHCSQVLKIIPQNSVICT